MILKARAVVTMDSAPIANGALSIRENQILAVGSLEVVTALDPGPVQDLGDQVLLPGLINAHCHLDYTMMRNAIPPPKNFTAWVQRINAIKRSLDSEDYLRAIEQGFAQLTKWGTTSVCNIEAFPELMPRMPVEPIRTWWFYEMIDVRHRITTDDVVAGALLFFEHRASCLGGFGLSPHAPYTASQSLYKLANDCAAAMTMPLTTHLAESCDEFAMFRRGAGPLHDLLKSLLRPMEDCGAMTPFELLWKSGSINARWILAHMNELTEEDFALLASLPPGGAPHIVHCPGSHRYFGHAPFPFRRLHDLGVNLCVGTDSLASTDSLSLLGELRRLRLAEPWLSCEDLLRCVTVHPARALQREGMLGQIKIGALADLIALPFHGPIEAVYEEIVAFKNSIPWMMIDGKAVL